MPGQPLWVKSGQVLTCCARSGLISRADIWATAWCQPPPLAAHRSKSAMATCCRPAQVGICCHAGAWEFLVAKVRLRQIPSPKSLPLSVFAAKPT